MVARKPIPGPVPGAPPRLIGSALIGLLVCFVALVNSANAQMGGMGGMGGGMGGGGGPQPPAVDEKPKWREHVHSRGGIMLRREKGDAIVADVRLIGNRRVGVHQILKNLSTRKDRFYDSETVLADVRRLNEMGAFNHVSFKTDETEQGVLVTFIVRERPMIDRVVYHGKRAMNERELVGRSGVAAGDPLNEFAIESGRKRLLDFYHEEGFNQAVVTSQIGIEGQPGTVLYRINEGPLERIRSISIEGSTIVKESRLKKIIKSRDSFAGVYKWAGNVADMRQLDGDKDVLAQYLHDLGFLTASVGRRIEYSEDGKWLDVHFVIKEGPRFTINDVQVIGHHYVTEESIRRGLELDPGDVYDGGRLRMDVGKIVYGYGELGFIYADVRPRTIMREDSASVDLVYEIQENDRIKTRNIIVEIGGESHMMRESTILNMIDLREGDFIDRRSLEINRDRLLRGNLLEVNPQIADPPDIKIVPVNEAGGQY